MHGSTSDAVHRAHRLGLLLGAVDVAIDCLRSGKSEQALEVLERAMDRDEREADAVAAQDGALRKAGRGPEAK